MERLVGKSVFKEIAIGPVLQWGKKQTVVTKKQTEDTEAEVSRFEKAGKIAGEQLSGLYDKALMQVGRSGAAIFEVHRMLLEDGGYQHSVCDRIRSQCVTAEFAVAAVGEELACVFDAMDDEYMRTRAGDIRDVSERLLRILTGTEEAKQTKPERPVILYAEDLSPSEMIRFDKTKLLALVTKLGSTNSHTAILARNMGIPALVGVEGSKEINGKWAIVDGYTGMLIIDPEKEVLEEYQKKKEREETRKKLLQELKGKETRTKDGKKIQLCANIANAADAADALENDAEGIGLFRSEFLYLEAEDYPSEEKQFEAYSAVVKKMAGKEVVIRTLDIGADKQTDYFHPAHEENPAMGLRAIRISLTWPEILKVQLRAILRASIYGRVAVMFPMITDLWEIRRAKELLQEAKEELKEKKIPFREIEIGVMIETPAAVMISDLLAKEADFFSIGTNDLTQYTLAVDRQNQSIDRFYDAHHEAVLRMIAMTVENGHKEKIRVGICGELAADTELTEYFIKLGVDELSVSPSYILPLREQIGRL